MAVKVLVKDGKLATYGGKVVEVEATGAEAIEWHQCPEAVRNFLANVTYDPSDYSTSQISQYVRTSIGEEDSKPLSATADGKVFYNEIPNVATPFATGGTAGTLKPLDQIRWLKTVGTPNVRDIGGWACDGGTVKYGKIFRGGEPSQSDIGVLIGEIGISAELELQGTEGGVSNAFDGKVDYCCPLNGSYWAYYSEILKNKVQVKEALDFVIDAVCHGKPIYIHCSAGADRTGTVICIIEGILGVAQSDCDKDYELTSFAGNGYLRKRCGRTAAETGTVEEVGYKNLISSIVALPGMTFRDKCVEFVVSCGITTERINAFRSAMIAGTPTVLTPTINNYTVSRVLSGATADNSTTSATQYQPYTDKIVPENGKVISGVKITMGGVDITSAAFSGTQAIRRHAVTKTLKNCTIDNAKKAAADGEGYGATITPVGGYTLTGATITIMMGGVDVSTYYSGGKIAIPSVTGDIAITVTAVPTTPAYTNLFDPSGIHAGYRINSGSALEANSSQNVSNDIELGGSGVIVRIKGSKANTDASTYRICYFNGTTWTGAIYLQNAEGYAYDAVTDTITFTSNSNALYTKLRFSYPSTTDSAAIVVTVNEAIE